eukprot:TRINITY_DN17355_c0_g1_i1.p1 TRINITY_DN17355_c0_g1~~TRINITY_DN17355_c0_g1_i1.p1  ORF type:complete len:437 (+),score=72.08 TRINITY_DN17355_c0_g1_i1:73-1383(+)
MAMIMDDVGMEKHAEAIASVGKSMREYDQSADEICNIMETVDKDIQNKIERMLISIKAMETTAIQEFRYQSRQLIKKYVMMESSLTSIYHQASKYSKLYMPSLKETRLGQVKGVISITQPLNITHLYTRSIYSRLQTSISAYGGSDFDARWFSLGFAHVDCDPLRYTLRPGSVFAYGTGPREFNQPIGICCHPHQDRIFVSEYGNHRIQIFTKDLEFVSVFGSKGVGENHFTNPCDIAISEGGLIACSDSMHYIHLLRDGFEYVKIFGEEGSKAGQFSMGQWKHLAFDEEECLYVSDYKNRTVQKFSENGDFIKFIYKPPARDPQRMAPVGITVNSSNEVLVVFQPGNQVRVYSVMGRLLRTHTVTARDEIMGISRGPRGGFVVTDRDGREIIICDKEGNRVNTLTSHSPWGVALSSDGDLYVTNYFGAGVSKFSV